MRNWRVLVLKKLCRLLNCEIRYYILYNLQSLCILPQSEPKRKGYFPLN